MNSFLPSTPFVPPVVHAAAERTRVVAVAPVASVQTPPAPPARLAVARTEGTASTPPATATAAAEGAEARAAYARVQAGIADTLSLLGAPAGTAGGHAATPEQAEASMMALMPQPVMILPLPPASEDMVAFVAQVTQSIARQAAQATAAQASLSPAKVDAVTA